MGNTIQISAPALGSGLFGVASVQILVSDEDGNPISSTSVTFNVKQFTSVGDSMNPEYGKCVFGSYTLEITNGLYSSYEYNNSVFDYPYEVSLAIGTDVGNL